MGSRQCAWWLHTCAWWPSGRASIRMCSHRANWLDKLMLLLILKFEVICFEALWPCCNCCGIFARGSKIGGAMLQQVSLRLNSRGFQLWNIWSFVFVISELWFNISNEAVFVFMLFSSLRKTLSSPLCRNFLWSIVFYSCYVVIRGYFQGPNAVI